MKTKQAIGLEYLNDTVATLTEVWAQLLGAEKDELNIDTPFLEMGADSLCLLQASQTIRNRFGVKVPFRMMLDEYSTIDSLAAYIDRHLPEAIPAGKHSASEASGNASRPEQLEALPHAQTQQLNLDQKESQSDMRTQQPALKQSIESLLNEEAHRLPSGGRNSPAPSTALENILAQQLQVLFRQLEVLSGRQSLRSESPSGQGAQPLRSEPDIQPDARRAGAVLAEARPAMDDHPPKAVTDHPLIPPGNQPVRKIEPKTFIAHEPISSGLNGRLNSSQQKHLNDLIARFTERTQGSKRLAEKYRGVLADSRATAGFRLLWKEMVYPLIIERAAGSKVWDVDGNEYIDLTMGFGALLFGHSPSFILEALQEQIQLGLQLGGESSHAGKAAELIRELTGVERVAFCNSGTEAVMTALRLARTVTGRTKIAFFEGGYHGTFDQVLVRGQKMANGRLKALPVAPGIPQHMIDEVILLSVNDSRCFDVLRENASELAAVMIEPRQSRRPDLDSRSFLHQLRRFTDEAGAALILDEVVTGFRFHPGGAQALFGVQADLVTYGKAMAGGLPVAAVAGKAAYLDAVDGGMWHYGDTSYPQVETTYFAGTHFMHPLLMPSVCAALNHIKESGLALQERIDRLTSRAAESLNEYFEREQVPMRVAQFGSLFRFFFPPELKYSDLFYYYLLDKGIYISETRGCILSTAHTDQDIDEVIERVKQSVEQMRMAGFLPAAVTQLQRNKDLTGGDNQPLKSASSVASPSGFDLSAAAGIEPSHTAGTNGKRSIPTTDAQKAIWALSQMGDDAARAYHQSFTVRIQGSFNLEAMRRAIQGLVNRHEALRITFSPDGDFQHIHYHLPVEVPSSDFSNLDDQVCDAQVEQRLREEARQPFSLTRGPLLRALVIKLRDCHMLVLTIHHIVTDGWSNDVVQQELGALYLAECQGTSPRLPDPIPFSEYVLSQAADQSSDAAADEAYWLEVFADPATALNLPTDRPRPPEKTYAGARESLTLDRDLYCELKSLSAHQGGTLLMVLVSAYNVLLHKLTGQNDIVIGVHLAGQVSVDGQNLVGHCVNLLPLRSRMDGTQFFSDYLASVKQMVLAMHKHQGYALSKLIKKLSLARSADRLPFIEVTFNLDVMTPKLSSPDASEDEQRPAQSDLKIEIVSNPTGSLQWDMSLNMIETGDQLVAEFDYNTDLFDSRTIRTWAGHFVTLLRSIAAHPGAKLSTLQEMLNSLDRQEWDLKKDELGRAFHTTRRTAIRGTLLKMGDL